MYELKQTKNILKTVISKSKYNIVVYDPACIRFIFLNTNIKKQPHSSRDNKNYEMYFFSKIPSLFFESAECVNTPIGVASSALKADVKAAEM